MPVNHYLVFTLGSEQYAMPISKVKRILRIVYITPLPEAPPVVSGIINIQGKIIPVINIRKCISIPDREINLTDQLIITKISKWTIALWVDSVIGLIEKPEEEIISKDQIVNGLKYIDGIIKSETDILIINLDDFFSLEEEKILEKTL